MEETVNFEYFLFRILISRSIVNQFEQTLAALCRYVSCIQGTLPKKLQKSPVRKIHILARKWIFDIFSPFSAEFSLKKRILRAIKASIERFNSISDIRKRKFYREIWMQILAGKFKLQYFRFPVSDFHQILQFDAVLGPVEGARIRAQLSQTVQTLFKKNDFRKTRKSDFGVQICKNLPRRKNPGRRYHLRRTPTQSASNCQI